GRSRGGCCPWRARARSGPAQRSRGRPRLRSGRRAVGRDRRAPRRRRSGCARGRASPLRPRYARPRLGQPGAAARWGATYVLEEYVRPPRRQSETRRDEGVPTRSIHHRVLLWCLLGVLPSPPFPGRGAQAQQPLERLLYYVDGENSYASLVKHIDQITVLGPQVYTIDSLGIVWVRVDRRVPDRARLRGRRVAARHGAEASDRPARRGAGAATADPARRGR